MLCGQLDHSYQHHRRYLLSLVVWPPKVSTGSVKVVHAPQISVPSDQDVAGDPCSTPTPSSLVEGTHVINSKTSQAVTKDAKCALGKELRAPLGFSLYVVQSIIIQQPSKNSSVLSNLPLNLHNFHNDFKNLHTYAAQRNARFAQGRIFGSSPLFEHRDRSQSLRRKCEGRRSTRWVWNYYNLRKEYI